MKFFTFSGGIRNGFNTLNNYSTIKLLGVIFMGFTNDQKSDSSSHTL